MEFHGGQGRARRKARTKDRLGSPPGFFKVPWSSWLSLNANRIRAFLMKLVQGGQGRARRRARRTRGMAGLLYIKGFMAGSWEAKGKTASNKRKLSAAFVVGPSFY